MKTVKIVATLGFLVASFPATGQNMTPSQHSAMLERYNNLTANNFANMRLDPRQARSANLAKQNLDERKDPWRPVTSELMARTVSDDYLKKARYSTRVMIDYDGDGHMDVAQLFNNSKQSAVIVTYGGPTRKAPTVALKLDFRLDSGEELLAAGRNRMIVILPEVMTYGLFLDRTGPKVFTMGEE